MEKQARTARSDSSSRSFLIERKAEATMWQENGKYKGQTVETIECNTEN